MTKDIIDHIEDEDFLKDIEDMTTLHIVCEDWNIFPSYKTKPLCRTIFMCKQRAEHIMDNPWCIEKDYPEIVNVLLLEHKNIVNNILIRDGWDGESDVDWINMN